MTIDQRFALRQIGFACLLISVTAMAVIAAPPENIAPQAKIAASSQFSTDYVAALVADNQIPGPMSHADVGKAWCAQGNQHPRGVQLTFTWPAPMHVSELVYFGRTAFEWQENWKDYELRDVAGGPVLAKGQ